MIYEQGQYGDPAKILENKDNWAQSQVCKTCQYHQYENGARVCSKTKQRGIQMSICNFFRPRQPVPKPK